MEKTQHTDDTTGQGPVRYQVHFGVYIPEMHRSYTRQELENDPEICAYLLEIGSGAVSVITTI